MSQLKYPYYEFSGALQQKSTTHIKKPNELRSVKNADFWSLVGAIRRRPGAQSTVATLPKLPNDSVTLAGYAARFPGGLEIWAAQNDSATSPTKSTLQRWTGPNAGDWTLLRDSLPIDAEINMTDDVDEVWAGVYKPSTDVISPSFTVDSTHSVSETRQLAYGPDARFFMEFNGSMWAFDCLIGSDRFRDRIYKSSGLTGAITFVRSPQTDPLATFVLTNQAPIMTSLTAPAGTVSGSTTYSTYDAWRAFDNATTLASSWMASATTGWLKYDFGAGVTKAITHYSIMAIGTDDSAHITRAPKTWTFEGSNDNSSWTTINTQTNVAAWAAGEKRTFATSNVVAYRYYRINVSANQGDASYQCITEAELLMAPTSTNLIELAIDSVRYLKPGMVLDIYTAGTNTLLYSPVISDVDKINDTIKFIPISQSFATTDVNTDTDVITLPDATAFTTGKPIIFGSTGAVPTGLTAGTTYYAINVSGTTIKVATSLLNATIGSAVDITAAGSGVHRVQLSYVFSNKDEVWASGRKGKLTRFWNTDYRNPEASDYIKLPPTIDGQNAITACGKIANRMFIWTANAMIKFDGNNIAPIRNDVGCAAMKSVAYYDTFMVWLDQKGNIWVRNEEAGTQDVISEAIQETMDLVPQSQLSQAVGGCVGHKYKLYLGQIDGVSLRVVYNFKTNQWSTEWWTPKMPIALEYTYNNTAKLHFFDEKGQFWVDEQGTDDNGIAIPFEAEIGDDNFGIDEIKNPVGIKVYSKNAAGTKVFVSVDGEDEEREVGQITKRIDSIAINSVPKGVTFNFKFKSTMLGDTPQIEKATVWYNPEEDTFRATQK